MEQQPLTDITFEGFDLHPSLLSGLRASGFTRCTPIQALTLPIALAGRDVAGQAQTGTGKTGAFLVALLNRLLTRPALPQRKLSDPRALIVAPTRELAIQIDKDFHAIGRDTGLSSALIYGGVDYDKQRDALRAGCDLVIATPGRLIDYLKQHVFSLNGIEVVVLDEADRMFDLGFIKDIRFLFRRMPPREERQSMLFSATLSLRVLELAYEHMNEPEKLTVETEHVTADRVRQVVYFPAREEKQPLLVHLLSALDVHRSIVFVNTRAAAERVTHSLERHGFGVATLSGDVPQAKRERLLAKFKRGEIETLVATDVAARGLHIPDVTHVFNYDLPQDAEDYVHRIGRTARLGAEGDAVSFACDLYAIGLPDIEAYIGQKIPTAAVTPELLVAPPPRPRATPRAKSAEQAEAEAADDARNTSGPPPKQTAAGRTRRPRDGARASGEARRAREAAPRARRRDHPAAEVPESATNPAVTPVAEATATGEPRRRRRRRGGRGRKQQPGAEASAATQATAAAPGGKDGEASGFARAGGERKPRRGRERSLPTEIAAVPVVPATAAKPGIFRRIGRMLGLR